MATFADRLKELREEKGVSQSYLASEIGVASNTVSIWERGVREPDSNDTYYALAEYFDVPLTYLVGISDSREWPVMSDADGAVAAEAEEQEIESSMLRLYRDLNPEMQSILRSMLATMWRAERDRGALKSQTESKD